MRTVVVTGASDGIGLECASQVAAMPGHRVVLVGRTPAKLEAAVARIAQESPGAELASYTCDFAHLDDVRRLAAHLLRDLDRIDVLISNAGTVFDRRTVTEDGFEATFAVNHLAGFLLVEVLLDRIVASAPARIVITASTGHHQGRLDLDDLAMERGYTIMRAYSRSKLANVLHARELARRLAGTGVTVNAFHPGTVATSIWAGAPWYARPVLAVVKRVAMSSPADGGAALARLAVGEDVEGLTGAYVDVRRVQEPSTLAQDDALGDRLAVVSRELVGLT